MPGESKAVLRQRLIEGRRTISPGDRQKWSAAICRHVEASGAFARARAVVTYLPIGAEVDPSQASATAAARGRPVYVPADDGGCLGLRLTAGSADGSAFEGTSDGGHGMLFLVPGLAFDRIGHRLGRGRGWYDRLLARHPAAHRCGLAFSLQILPDVPVDAWDESMDMVVTEDGCITPTSARPRPEGTQDVD